MLYLQTEDGVSSQWTVNSSVFSTDFTIWMNFEFRRWNTLHADITPIPEFDLPHLYVSDSVVQRSTDKSQSTVVFRYVDIRMALKANSTDSRHNDGGTDTERLEQTTF